MHIKPSFSSLLVAAATAKIANAWFRLPCTVPIVQEAVDPILSPGAVSQHLHSVHGGNNFSMNQTYTSMTQSSCSSCEVAQDLSNYWTPTLYFKDPVAGTFTKVPNGGLLVYYLFRGDADVINGGPGLTAFPPGFRMLSGNAAKRSQLYAPGLGTQAELAERALIGSCLRYTTENPGYSYYGFPTTDCEAGLNARLQMPTCWDGKNLWLPNNAHVSYLSDLDNGSCDAAHPVTFIHLFYEVTWDLSSFSSKWVPQGYPWPFVYSNSDPTGWGYHGDFYNGWQPGVLQNAIAQCNTPSNADQMAGVVTACTAFTVNSADTSNACTIKNVEVAPPLGIQGPLAQLPGCNPLQYGPCDATLYPQSTSPCPAKGPACPAGTSTTTAAGPAPTGTYLGCYNDSQGDRLINGYYLVDAVTMTNADCIQTCIEQGYLYAGTEYGNECYCGNTAPAASALDTNSADCNMPCAGSGSTICGGNYKLSVYEI